VDGLAAMHAHVAFGLAGHVEIGVGIPLLQGLVRGESFGAFGGDADRAPLGIGDLRIEGRFRPLPLDLPLDVALVPEVTLPTGTRSLHMSRGVPTVGGRIAVGARWTAFRFAVHGGYRWGPGFADVGGWLAADDEVLLGAGVAASPVPDLLTVGLEANASVFVGGGRKSTPDSPFTAQLHVPAELLLHVGVQLPAGFSLTVGGGPGLGPAPGTPLARGVIALGWTPRRPPAQADADSDGLPDHVDACPNVAEDRDGFRDEDGCPDIDDDSDGIGDHEDRCPSVPEDLDGFQDADGCPDPDDDRDGVLDADDLCPNQREDVNGVRDADGCPDDVLAVLVGDTIRPLAPIGFEPASMELSADGQTVLDQIAVILAEHPELLFIRIRAQATDGSAESEGLSLDRALAIMFGLAERGVDPSRMEAVPHGDAPNTGNVSFEVLERTQEGAGSEP